MTAVPHDLLGVVGVTSHRGGVGKSLLAGALAAHLAGQGLRTLLVDLAPGGGAASLGPAGLMPDHEPWQGNDAPKPRPLSSGLFVLRVTPAAVAGGGWHQLEEWVSANDVVLVMIDAPTMSRQAMGAVASRCSVVLAAVRCDAPSLKSLMPFFEFLAEEKNRPNRAFQPMAVLTRVQLNDPPQQALYQSATTFLAPLLIQGMIPEDPSLADAMARGMLPARGVLSASAAGAIANLAQQIQAKLDASAPDAVAR